MQSVFTLLQYTLIFSSVLTLVAIGGAFSEHSGVINLGLEGCMSVGALAGALVLSILNPELPAIFIILIVIAVSIAAGLAFSALLAVASINCSADQTLVGTAMNMMALAVTAIIARAINMSQDPNNVSTNVNFVDQRKALVLDLEIFGYKYEFNWFVIVTVIAVIVSYIVLYKTVFGLRLMSCGEHPQASASVGINVFKMRWTGVLISGAFAGLGGICYITAAVSQWKFENGVAGFGFLALAVMIFGQWKPHRIIFAALVFGFFRALSNVYFGFPFLLALQLPSTIYNMLPYIISLIILAITSKKSKAPKAEGIPYDVSLR